MTTPDNIDRREFLAAAAATAAAATGAQAMPDGARSASEGHRARSASEGPAPAPAPGDSHRGPCIIASGNGMKTVELAWELMSKGARPVEACVRGVNLVESDPEDMSVGYGGLPNEDGVIQLDAACMDGPLHKAGAVACIEDIKNPASVALEVLRRTDHVLLVGEGAKRFALRVGFKAEDLQTEASRKAWADWRANLNKDDKWLDADQIINFPEPWRQSANPPPPRGGGGRVLEAGGGASGHVTLDPWGNPFTYGTIHCSAVNADKDIGCCTTTSGLSWKLPGRVGDSPLLGCGLYCDNAAGSAGATGRGESVILTLGAFWIVEAMRTWPDKTPTQLCLEACQRIVDRTHEPRMFDENKRPRFSVTFYAVRKNGAYGSACILKGGYAAVCTEGKAQRLDSEFLYE